MFRNHHNWRLSIEESHVPFGGILDPECPWVFFSSLFQLDVLEASYAPNSVPQRVPQRSTSPLEPGSHSAAFQQPCSDSSFYLQNPGALLDTGYAVDGEPYTPSA
jgi:hypothetical protein